MTRSMRDEVLEVVREMPGLKSGQIVDLMPHAKKQSVYAMLNKLMMQGIVVKNNGCFTMVVGDPVPPVRKRSSFAEVVSAATIDSLRAQVRELEAWKADALKRFPDLAVSELVRKARDIVADEVLVCGDTKSADDIRAGRRDTALPMRLVIKMLEGSL